MKSLTLKMMASIIFFFTYSSVLAQTTGNWGSSSTATTTTGAVGVGTTSPSGQQEIKYCDDTQNGLVVTKFECSGTPIYNPGTNDPLNYSFDGFYESGTESWPSASLPTSFTSPINYSLTAYNSSSNKPLIWARVENPSSVSSSTSGAHTSRFLVFPYGRAGFNVENPRATVDIKTLSSGYDFPVLILGRQALGTTDKTQHMHFIPLLNENGYNRITKRNDQGIFFTDGKGTDGVNSDGAFVLAPWADGTDENVGGMRMDKYGNIEVHGQIKCTKVRVNAKWWSDFVFDSQYQLMPLSELKKYITIQKHLPNIPSEAEILNEGSDVATMQALQMQKIEELTLYVIQLNERIAQLESQISGKK